MQPAVRLLLGSVPQPVFFTGVISGIAVGEVCAAGSSVSRRRYDQWPKWRGQKQPICGGLPGRVLLQLMQVSGQ